MSTYNAFLTPACAQYPHRYTVEHIPGTRGLYRPQVAPRHTRPNQTQTAPPQPFAAHWEPEP